MLRRALIHRFCTGFSRRVWTTTARGVRGAGPSSEPRRAGYVGVMEAQRRLCGFSATLERLLAARDAAAFEAEWIAQDVQRVGWEALALARQANTEALEPVLAEVDRRLLAVPGRRPAVAHSALLALLVTAIEH